MNKKLIKEKSFNLTKNEWLKEINETLLKLGVQLCNSQGYYRSIYSLFDELSEKWHLLKEEIQMKYYECDMCGEICHSTITYNPFKDGEWTHVEFNVNNEEINWEYDKETDSYITHDTITTIRHYCPLCYEKYCNSYRPFLPAGK